MSAGVLKIWLASYPRSGNTYARLLLRHNFGIDALPPWGRESGQEVYECELTSGLNARRGSPVYAIKTHSLAKDGSPAIVLVRDGRDALLSHVYFLKRFWGARGSFEPVLARMIDPHDTLGEDWSAFYEHWLYAASGRTALIRYEELVDRPLEVIWNALARVLGDLIVPRTLDPLPPFAEFHRQKPGFFRRGMIGGWKEEMSPELEATFWHHHGQMMTRLGYER
jgi:hypothetical protein